MRSRSHAPAVDREGAHGDNDLDVDIIAHGRSNGGAQTAQPYCWWLGFGGGEGNGNMVGKLFFLCFKIFPEP